MKTAILFLLLTVSVTAQDSTLVKELQGLVETTRVRLEKLDKDIAEAQKQREQLFGALQAYYVLYQREEQKISASINSATEGK